MRHIFKLFRGDAADSGASLTAILIFFAIFFVVFSLWPGLLTHNPKWYKKLTGKLHETEEQHPPDVSTIRKWIAAVFGALGWGGLLWWVISRF